MSVAGAATAISTRGDADSRSESGSSPTSHAAMVRTCSMSWSRFIIPSWAANCTARPSTIAVMRMAAAAGLLHTNSARSTPLVMTRSSSSADCSSSSWLILRIIGLRSASPQPSIQSIHSMSLLPSGT